MTAIFSTIRFILVAGRNVHRGFKSDKIWTEYWTIKNWCCLYVHSPLIKNNLIIILKNQMDHFQCQYHFRQMLVITDSKTGKSKETSF